MARQWTREERKKRIHGRFYTYREKAFVLAFIVLMFLFLLAAIFFAFSAGADPFLLGMLILALLLMMPASIFLFDTFLNSTE